jgi:hypothetical protein
VRLVTIPGAEPDKPFTNAEIDTAVRAEALADETISVLCELQQRGLAAPVIGVVANRRPEGP